MRKRCGRARRPGGSSHVGDEAAERCDGDNRSSAGQEATRNLHPNHLQKCAQVTRHNLMVKLKNECKMVKSSRSQSTRVFEIHSSKEVRYTTACREPRSPPSSLHVSKKNILPNPLTSTPAFLRAQIEKQIDVP